MIACACLTGSVENDALVAFKGVSYVAVAGAGETCRYVDGIRGDQEGSTSDSRRKTRGAG